MDIGWLLCCVVGGVCYFTNDSLFGGEGDIFLLKSDMGMCIGNMGGFFRD